MSQTVMLTGGAGYIGSHTVLALIEAGVTPVILDDFSNSSPAVLERLQRIAGTTIVCDAGAWPISSLLRIWFTDTVLTRSYTLLGLRL